MNPMTHSRTLLVIAPQCHTMAAFLKGISDHKSGSVFSFRQQDKTCHIYNDRTVKQLWGLPFLGMPGEKIFPNNAPLHNNKEHRGQENESIPVLLCHSLQQSQVDTIVSFPTSHTHSKRYWFRDLTQRKHLLIHSWRMCLGCFRDERIKWFVIEAVVQSMKWIACSFWLFKRLLLLAFCN